MPSKPLLVVQSSGFFKRDVFEIARNLGYETVAVENAESTGETANLGQRQSVRTNLYGEEFPGAAIDALREAGVTEPGGVCTLLELAVVPTARLAQHYNVPGLTPEAARKARDKYSMRRAWAGIVGQPKCYSLAGTSQDVANFFDRRAHESGKPVPIILKPRDLGASTGVRGIDSQEEVADVWSRCQQEIEEFAKEYSYRSPYGELLVEDRIPPGGRELNVDMFVHDGVPYVLGVAEKADPMEGQTFREDAYVFPAYSLTTSELTALVEEAKKAVQALGVTCGAVHLEARMVGDPGSRRPYIIELGARCGGDLEMPGLKLHCGTDLRELQLRQAMRDLRPSDIKAAEECDRSIHVRSGGVAIQVVYASKPMTLTRDLSLSDECRRRYRVAEARFAVRAGYEVKLPENDYLGAVIALGETPPQAVLNVQQCVSSIRVE